MKIFIVCSCLTNGGAERVGVMLANGFARRGHDVSIVTNIYQKATYEVDDNIKIFPLNPKTNFIIRKWIGALFLIRKYVRSDKPDAVIGIMQLCSFVSRLACLGTGIPVIMTEHDAYQRLPSIRLTKMEIFSKFYLDKIYRCVTILTEADRKFIGNRLKNVVVMPNPSTFPPYQGEFHKEKILLAAGRISNWHCKGFDLLIEAWGKIAEKFTDWKLELAGDGSKEDFCYLKQLAAKYGVTDRMEFLGYRSDMLSLYQKAAIYVLSSRSEGLPMVIIEAMGQGCACVAVENFGRTKEMITNEEEGLLCEMENPDALSAVMEKMIVDEDYRKKVQLKSIARSEYYSLDHVIGLWEQLLSSIIK